MWKTVLSGIEGFTDIQYGEKGVLAASSWDSNVYLFNGNERTKFTLRAPALALAFGFEASATQLFCGGAEQHLSIYDITSARLWDIGGDHQNAITSIQCIGPHTLVSGGLDAQLQLCDSRSDLGVFYQLPGKVIDTEFQDNKLFVGMTDRLLNIYDVRKLSEPLFSRKMRFKHPIKAVTAFKGGRYYGVSSVCSRVILECIDNPNADFAFRAHQSPTNTFMVNDMATWEGDLTTAGADRTIQVWDPKAKTKLYQYPTLPMPVQHISYSPDGKLLAAAVSDDTYTRTPGVAKVPGQLLVAERVPRERMD